MNVVEQQRRRDPSRGASLPGAANESPRSLHVHDGCFRAGCTRCRKGAARLAEAMSNFFGKAGEEHGVGRRRDRSAGRRRLALLRARSFSGGGRSRTVTRWLSWTTSVLRAPASPSRSRCYPDSPKRLAKARCGRRRVLGSHGTAAAPPARQGGPVACEQLFRWSEERGQKHLHLFRAGLTSLIADSENWGSAAEYPGLRGGFVSRVPAADGAAVPWLLRVAAAEGLHVHGLCYHLSHETQVLPELAKSGWRGHAAQPAAVPSPEHQARRRHAPQPQTSRQRD